MTTGFQYRARPQEQARRFVLEKPAGHASIGKRKQPINSRTELEATKKPAGLGDQRGALTVPFFLLHYKCLIEWIHLFSPK